LRVTSETLGGKENIKNNDIGGKRQHWCSETKAQRAEPTSGRSAGRKKKSTEMGRVVRRGVDVVGGLPCWGEVG